jgi:hypothetical protein
LHGCYPEVKLKSGEILSSKFLGLTRKNLLLDNSLFLAISAEFFTMGERVEIFDPDEL